MHHVGPPDHGRLYLVLAVTMRELLRIETDRAVLTWRDAGAGAPVSAPGTFAPGRVLVAARRPGIAELRVFVNGSAAAGDVAPVPLYEQHDYSVYVRAAGSAQTV